MKKVFLAVIIALFIAGSQWGIDTVPLPEFSVSKAKPSKINLEKGGKKVLIILQGRNLLKVNDVSIGIFKGKKFIPKNIHILIVRKKSNTRMLTLEITPGSNIDPDTDYIMRLFGKKRNRRLPHLDLSQKLIKISVNSKVAVKRTILPLKKD